MYSRDTKTGPMPCLGCTYNENWFTGTGANTESRTSNVLIMNPAGARLRFIFRFWLCDVCMTCKYSFCSGFCGTMVHVVSDTHDIGNSNVGSELYINTVSKLFQSILSSLKKITIWILQLKNIYNPSLLLRVRLCRWASARRYRLSASYVNVPLNLRRSVRKSYFSGSLNVNAIENVGNCE